MGVINNLLKIRSCSRIGLSVLHYSSDPKVSRLHPVICNYVMQKQNLNVVLKKTSELQEIYRRKKKMSAVDMDLCIKLNSCNFNDMLVLLNSFVVMDFDYCMNSLFYQVFIENLNTGLLSKAKWDQLIQIVYFVAHRTKAEETKPLIINCLSFLNKLPELSVADYRDICVVSEAAFKTETLITSEKMIKRLKDICRNDCYNLMAEPIWFGMLFKGFDMIGKPDAEFFLEVGEILKRSHYTDNLDLMSVKQIVNAYAAANFKDEVVFDIFMKASAKYVRRWFRDEEGNKARRIRPPRLKDLSKILHSLTLVNYTIDLKLLEDVFVPCFLKLAGDQHDLNFQYKVECLYAFWCMGYDLEQIGDVCKRVVEGIPMAELRHRDVNRAYRLLVVISLEYPKLFNKKLKEIKSHLADQDSKITKVPYHNEGSLKFLKNLVDKYKKELKVSETILESPVEGAHLLGLTVIFLNGEKIHIDVPEKEYCCALSDSPNGFMVYKTKLLKHVPKLSRHITIKKEDLLQVQKSGDAKSYSGLKNNIFIGFWSC